MTREKALKALLLLCSAAFCLKALREPDFWWMLRTGEWIVEHGAVMTSDVFSYTREGTSWINVKWLYEVLIYGMSTVGGPESIPMLAALFYSFLLVLLWRTSDLTSKQGLVGLFIATLIFLIGAEFRMTGRPEMSSHLLTAAFLFLLHSHSKRPGKLIFLLIPLQVLWTNLHEGFGTGMVIVIAWLLMTLTQAAAGRKTDWKKPALITLGVILTPAISPNGIEMILHPLNIFSQLGDNQFTTELHSAATAYFWQQKEAYLLLVLLLVLGYKAFLALKAGFRNFIVDDSTQALGFAALFLALGLTAHRNIPFALIAAFPLLSSTISGFLEKLKINEKRWAAPSMMALSVLLYLAIVSNQYYKLVDSKNRFGLYVLSDKHPIASATALEERAVKQPIFADYLTSSYLLWNLRPDFKTFIDLRDLDVFDTEFFKQYAVITKIPAAFEQSDSVYHYGAVTLYQPALDELHSYLYKHPDWTVVSANPVAVTYQRGKHNEASFTGFPAVKPTALANAVNHLFNPFFEPNEPEKNIDFIAATYYSRMGNRSLAAKHLQIALQNDPENAAAWLEYGRLYSSALAEAESSDQMNALFSTAKNAFYTALKLDEENLQAYIGLSKLLVETEKYSEAYRITSAGLEVSPGNSILLQIQESALYVLATSNQSLILTYLETLTQVVDQNLENKPLRFRLSILLCEANRCEEAYPYLDGLVIPDLPALEQKRLSNCQRKCL